jgi:hypothetical protein
VAKKKRAIRNKDAAYRRKKRATEAEQKLAHKKAETVRKSRQQNKKMAAPDDFAKKVDALIEHATPQKTKALRDRHIYKASVRESMEGSLKDITASAKKVALNVLRKHQPKNKKGLDDILKLRRGTLSYKLKGRKNVNRKVWSIEANIVKKFYMQMGVSVLLSNKRKGTDDQPFYVMQLPIVAVYKEFTSAHPDTQIQLFKFQKIRSKMFMFNVKSL